MNVAKRKSPITGESFPSLSEAYKKEKEADGFDGVPDLQRSGNMLDSLSYRITSEGLELGVYGEAAPRADGHNNLSGDSKLPLRQFLPNVGESFAPSIEREIERIVADSRGAEAEIPFEELGGIEAPSELYNVLQREFQLETQVELRKAVLRSPRWYYSLERLGLLKWL